MESIQNEDRVEKNALETCEIGGLWMVHGGGVVVKKWEEWEMGGNKKLMGLRKPKERVELNFWRREEFDGTESWKWGIRNRN